MQRLFVVGVALLLLTGVASAETSFTTGGGHINGHSYDGDYSVDPGWYLTAILERDIEKWSMDNGLVKSYYGLQYVYAVWERQDHEEEVICEGDNGYFEPTVREYDNVRHPESHFALAFYKTNLKLHRLLSVFASLGGGYEFASDDGDGWAGTATGGLELRITQDFSAVAQYQTILTENRRFDMPGVLLKYSF